MYKNTPKFEDLDTTIPLFPLENVILLPKEVLPLNIFEPRYLNMVEDCLKKQRLIGMIQPNAQIGCLGRIVSFTETRDGLYLIHLRGVCRFEEQEALSTTTLYKQSCVSYEKFKIDMETKESFFPDRDCVLNSLRTYFEKHDMECDWKAIEQTSDTRLISLLSMICPFSPPERQALLEAPTSCDRAKLLFSLLEIEKCQDDDFKNCH